MKVLFLLLFLSVSIWAQNSDSLRQKYGEPFSETFKVRPQVLLTVKYAKTGEVCSMRIEPLTFRFIETDDAASIKSKLLDEILEELVPENQRGKFLVGTHRLGLLANYELVEILRNGETDKWRYTSIQWKIKACGY